MESIRLALYLYASLLPRYGVTVSRPFISKVGDQSSQCSARGVLDVFFQPRHACFSLRHLQCLPLRGYCPMINAVLVHACVHVCLLKH